MKRTILVVAVCMLVFAGIASADTFNAGTADEFTIDFVTISGDTNPTSGYGIIDNDFRMGKYEITNGQWQKFQTSYGTVTGDPSSAYDTTATWAGTNVPANGISWYETAQFVNYLNTSTGHPAAYKFTGTQGTGDYTFALWDSSDIGYDSSNPFRNSNAKYVLPTEDEWVKAAYWNGTTLQTFATTDNSIPVAGVDTNYKAIGNPWDVGSGSEELNGTYDMMGNLAEWMEDPYGGSYSFRPEHAIRGGGAFESETMALSPFFHWGNGAQYEVGEFGYTTFRVASVPEPYSLVLLSVGSLVLRRIRKP